MMRDAIEHFPEQFSFEPAIQNAASWHKYRKFVVCGMGGSHLAADIIRGMNPKFDITVHADFGLPELSTAARRKTLFIMSSYSGNTEETLDALERAHEAGLAIAAIAVGGKLLVRAKEFGIPYVALPDTGIQPRAALGYDLMALLKLMGREPDLKRASRLAKNIKSLRFEKEGTALAEKLKDHVPVVYASSKNAALAYIWKITFNETGKIPAFYNIVPELDHNEMTGFDAKDSTRDLSSKFHFLLLADSEDDPRIKKRIELLAKLYVNRGLSVTMLELHGRGFQKIFSSVILADWTALRTAELYGTEPEKVPMVEEFKYLLEQHAS